MSKLKGSIEKLQEFLGQTEQLQNELELEQLTLASLQRCESRLLNASNLHEYNPPNQISQEVQSLQNRCRRYGHAQPYRGYSIAIGYFSSEYHS